MPTYNSADMLDCANGHHSWTDNEGEELDECHVCGAKSAPEPQPVGGYWQPFYTPKAAPGEPEACSWTLQAASEADALARLAERQRLRPDLLWSVKPCFRFFASQRGHELHIMATEPACEGMPDADGNATVARFYLNDYRSKVVNPARLALAMAVLDFMNRSAP